MGPLLRFALIRVAEDRHYWFQLYHHLVIDGWGISIVVQHCCAFYNAGLSRAAPEWEPAGSYLDFVTAERGYRSSQRYVRDRRYWRESYATLPASGLGLTARGLSSRRVTFALERGSYDRLGDCARRHGVTLFPLFLSALHVLMSRMDGTGDRAIGIAMLNRLTAASKRTVGLFASILPIRLSGVGASRFPQLLRAVAAQLRRTYRHHRLPLSEINSLAGMHEQGRQQLFDVVLSYEPHDYGVDFGGHEVEAVVLSAGFSQFPLALALHEYSATQKVRVDVDYDPESFDDSAVKRLARHFRTLLLEIARDPSRCVCDLSLLSGPERHQTLVEWNDTATGAPLARGVEGWLAAWAKKAPEALALIFAERHVSYRELDRRSHQLAHHLRELGVGPEVPVGLFLERSIEMVVGLYAILRSGGAYVPLDPDLPPKRRRYMSHQARLSFVVSREKHLAEIDSLAVRTVCLDRDARSIARAPASDPGCTARPENLAYVIYTSGSTGRPQGVRIHRRSLASFTAAALSEYGIEQGDRVLQFAPLAFDTSAEEVFPCLSCGATLVLRTESMMGSIPVFLRECARLGITVLDLPTAFWHRMSAEMSAAPLRFPRSVRRVIIGGERALGATRAQWDRLATPPLINSYGPSEATVVATVWKAPGPGSVTSSARNVPIGRPLRGVRTFVLGPRLETLAIGFAGELRIGGAGLQRGYLGEPGRTAEKLVPDPFTRAAGQRLYQSGDRARYLPDGHLEFLGRFDDQVKVRGVRIELGEVEEAVASHEAVAACAVALREDTPGEGRLVAYLVLAYLVPRAKPPSTRELRRCLRENLPESMVPSAFVFLESLPRLSNGKVDRRALLHLEGGTTAAEASFVLPRNELEEVLAGIWSTVLGKRQVSVRESFFELGGDSLLAMKVLSRTREALDVELPLRSLFEKPTVAQQALAIGTARREGNASPAPALERLSRSAEPSASFAQERLWLLDRLEPGTAAYNMPGSVRLRGRLEVAALKRGFHELARRHEVLRTSFPERDGRPRPVTVNSAEVSLPVVDLRAIAPAGRRELERQVRGEAAAPFDLERGPLVRIRLLCLAEDEHVLLLTLHHILADGWSWGVLIRELAMLYRVLARGRPPEAAMLPRLGIRYVDYATWQRRWLSGSVLERQLGYWRRQLAGLARVELPADRARGPRPAARALSGGHSCRVLETACTEGLEALARDTGASLFMTLLAAVKVLLARWSGAHDVAVGIPISGRHRPQLEDLIGIFLNTLVLRTDLSGRPTFRQLVSRVRDVALQAYAHQDLPFEELLKELAVPRDLTRTPFFQVFVNMLNLPRVELELPGLATQLAPPPAVPAKFDLTLYADRLPNGLSLDLVYDQNLFERARIEELLDQLTRLLAGAVEEPDASIENFSLRTASAAAVLPDPRQRLDEAWRGPVHELIAEAARGAPQRIAVSDPHRTLSYSELEARSHRLERRLLAAGVEGEQAVAIYAHRSAGLVWAILGVLKAGAAFVLLDPADPPRRLVEMARRVQPRLWLALSAAGPLPEVLAGFLAQRRVPVLELSPRGGAPGGGPLANAPPAMKPRADARALIALTSGSTGTPKGIEGRHGSLSHFLPWQKERFALAGSDRYSLLSGLTHDPLQRDVFTALAMGATLCIPDPDRMLEPGYVVAWMREQGVTIAHLTPAMGRLVAEIPRRETSEGLPRALELPSLRYVFLIGDVLTRRDVARLRRLASKVRVVNLYGSTETQRALSYYECGATETWEILPLGRGMGAVQLLLLNAGGGLAGIGEVGEIYVRSPHLARGYLADPRLTGEHFRPNPFAPSATDRLYRTGDLGRYLPDGNVEFLGRTDHQVKVRGFRIELGEVETVLARHQEVAACAVTVQEDAAEDRRLVAYLVPAGRAVPTVAQLRRHLVRELPEHMVPSLFVVLEALPLLPGGKVDRRALPSAALSALSEEGFAPSPLLADPPRGEPPRTETQELLAGIWSAVLGREDIGVGDGFFELGGHSLTATQVVSRVSACFGVELPLRLLFEKATLGELAEAIEARRGGAGSLRLAPPLEPRPRVRDAELSFAQQRLWFLDRFTPATAVYNIPVSVWLRGRLDVAALGWAFAEVARRHEVLRSRFSPRPDGTARVAPAVMSARLAVVDLESLGPSRRRRCAHRLANAEAARPFELTRGPLVRGCVLRLGLREHLLLISLHHIAADGWSMAILVRELSVLYSARRAGRSSPLAPLAVQYADFARWQRRWLDGPALAAQQGFWSRQLANLPVLELPTDRRRPAVASHRGGRCEALFPARLAQELRGLGRRCGATLFMALAAAFQVLLWRWSRQLDFPLGTPVAGRRDPALEELIGCFVNPLVLRADLTGGPSFADLLERVRRRFLAALDHQDMPFERLVEDLAVERQPSRSPLFQVMLVLQNTPVAEPELEGMRLRAWPRDTATAKFDLTLSVAEAEAPSATGGAAALAATFEYAAALFDRTTLRRWSAHYRRLLESVVAHPEAALTELRLSSRREEHQLALEWSADRARAVAPGNCLHELFAAPTRRLPEAIAVVCENHALSYAELDGRANQLAHHLRQLGVAPEVRVGLLVERSLETAVGLVAVLKAGGAYVPLDPAHPEERTSWVLRDARITVVLARERFATRFAGRVKTVCRDRDAARIVRYRRDPARGGGGPGEPVLRDLHLRIHRPSQRGDDAPRLGGWLLARPLRGRFAGFAEPAASPGSECVPAFRRFRPATRGVRRRAPSRGPFRGPETPPGAARRTPSEPPDRRPRHNPVPFDAVLGRGTPQGDPSPCAAGWRRADFRAPVAKTDLFREADLQSLRPDRVYDQQHADTPRSWRIAAADRPAFRCCPVADRRPGSQAASAGRDRRARHRRHRPRPGLSASRQPECRALRTRSDVRRNGRSDVSHRGPGPLSCRRQRRMPGTLRPPGEGAWFPDRARRGRGGLGAPRKGSFVRGDAVPSGGSSRKDAARRHAGGSLLGGLPGARPKSFPFGAGAAPPSWS